MEAFEVDTKDEVVTPQFFRKTLLALAVASGSLAVQAQTLSLTDSGIEETLTQYTDSVEITGTHAGKANDADAIGFNGVKFDKDLILNATVTPSGIFSDGIDLNSFDGDGTTPWTNNSIGGDLINRGNISVTGGGSAALLIDPAVIGGSVINEGTLSSIGEPQEDEGEFDENRAVDISGSTTIGGDLRNTASGKIIAEGTDATGISMYGARIEGSIVNEGSIQVAGDNATAIDLTSDEYVDYNGTLHVQLADVSKLINNGTITATGDDAVGLELDGVRFSSDTDHVINTGLIQATDAAISVGGFDIDDTTKQLRIVNSGTIISQDEAIDASEANGGEVYLDMRDGSKITGNLIDLNGVEVYGNAEFAGTDATSDGANIKLVNKGWVDVGEAAQAAHLNFTQPHTSIDGNLYVAQTSSIGLVLSSATDSSTPVLSVSGTAEFAKGSQITLAAQGKDFSATGADYTLVKAGTLDTHGEDAIKVSSTSALLNVDTYAVDGNQIVAKVTTKSDTEVEETVGGQGATGNHVQALNTFKNGVLGNITDANDRVLQAFANADEKQLAKLAAQLTPEVNGGATQAATTGQTLISNVTAGRTGAGRGLSSGDSFKETGVWVQTLYSDANQDLRDGVAGYNAYSRGIAIGADGKLNDQVTLGLAYSFLNTDVNGDTGNKTEVDGHAFTLYGGFEQGNYFVDGSLTYGLNDNDSKREVAGTSAKADYDSSLFGVNLIGGYTYHIDERFLVEPRIAARYSRVDIDSYREKGSSAALKVDGQRYEVMELGAGLRVAGRFPLGQGTLEPQAKLMAYHDFAADEAASTSTYVLGNTPFVTSGASAVRNSYEAGVGADYHLGAVTVGLNYDYTGKSGFDADTFTAKVRYDF